MNLRKQRFINMTVLLIAFAVGYTAPLNAFHGTITNDTYQSVSVIISFLFSKKQVPGTNRFILKGKLDARPSNTSGLERYQEDLIDYDSQRFDTLSQKAIKITLINRNNGHIFDSEVFILSSKKPINRMIKITLDGIKLTAE